MSGAHDPVAESEFVLRRIHKSHFNPGLPRTIHFAAFRPSKEDLAGLSVHREKYVTPAQIAAAGRKPGEYFVARLPVQALLALKLTVVPDEEPGDIPGHAVIPELSLGAYQADKDRLKDVQMELARLASHSLVHDPQA